MWESDNLLSCRLFAAGHQYRSPVAALPHLLRIMAFLAHPRQLCPFRGQMLATCEAIDALLDMTLKNYYKIRIALVAQLDRATTS